MATCTSKTPFKDVSELASIPKLKGFKVYHLADGKTEVNFVKKEGDKPFCYTVKKGDDIQEFCFSKDFEGENSAFVDDDCKTESTWQDQEYYWKDAPSDRRAKVIIVGTIIAVVVVVIGTIYWRRNNRPGAPPPPSNGQT